MSLLFKPSKIPRIPILVYHQVSEVGERQKKVRSTNPAYSLPVTRFREQMEYIKEHDYRTLSLDEVIDQSTHNHEKCVVITFDDGWANNYSNALPILAELGLTATVFVVTDFVGRQAYMGWGELAEMHNGGISIQSHTASHRPLSVLPSNEIFSELGNSKKTIEDRLDTSIEFLSAPHGMINQRVTDGARSTGYKAICTSEPGFKHSSGTLVFILKQ